MKMLRDFVVLLNHIQFFPDLIHIILILNFEENRPHRAQRTEIKRKSHFQNIKTNPEGSKFSFPCCVLGYSTHWENTSETQEARAGAYTDIHSDKRRYSTGGYGPTRLYCTKVNEYGIGAA
jgi:hypothetical protein